MKKVKLIIKSNVKKEQKESHSGRVSCVSYLFFLYFFALNITVAQKNNSYWINNTILTPHRMPLPNGEITFIDLDKDGDPDVMRYEILDGIPIQWIDDDDDMKFTDIEGDMDSDCLMIDRNKDGEYGSEYDLIIDWNDENGDQNADMQTTVDYSGFNDRGRWQAHYMLILDTDNDKIFNYIDWNKLKIAAWEHSGTARFFTDYHGKSIFLKAHTNTFNISDLRYHWENPFLFYDPDNDGQSEIAIRYVDDPKIITGLKHISKDSVITEVEYSIIYSKNITSVQMAFDLDNDSRPSNELDYDLSIKFSGRGFDYQDQVHKYKSLRGLPEADKYFYDARWRQLEELIYTNHENGYKLPFERGDWQSCWIVYDEDDDCHRWERVEFYDPKDPFKIGAKNGGLDNNPQADVTGDRGEWDSDFSGKGNLYIGKFDGRIHLVGAEWGAWRIDQNAFYYQGWQGWRGPNIQPEDLIDIEPEIVATIRYSDSNNNGFFDIIEEDLDGDKIYETKTELLKLGISDESDKIDISNYSYEDFKNLYKRISNEIWNNAIEALSIYKEYGFNPEWYSQFQNPKSLQEKYHFGYWLNFYIHKDLRQYAESKNDSKMILNVDKSYYSSSWKSFSYTKSN